METRGAPELLARTLISVSARPHGHFPRPNMERGAALFVREFVQTSTTRGTATTPDSAHAPDGGNGAPRNVDRRTSRNPRPAGPGGKGSVHADPREDRWAEIETEMHPSRANATAPPFSPAATRPWPQNTPSQRRQRHPLASSTSLASAKPRPTGSDRRSGRRSRVQLQLNVDRRDETTFN